MANKRMFAKTIVDSDNFLEMPMSARLLYYDLGMRADDDGFVNSPKKIMRIIGATTDDMNILIARKFIIPFDSGIVVIRHWRINNYLRSDRYVETTYIEEKSHLAMDDNNQYLSQNEAISLGIPLGIPVVDADKNSKDKKREEKNNKSNSQKDVVDNLSSSNVDIKEDKVSDSHSKYIFPTETSLWNELQSYGITAIRGITPNSDRARLLQARLKQYGTESFTEIVQEIKNSDFLQGKHNGRPWQITFDWVIKPNNYPKVLEGNYRNSGVVRGKVSQPTETIEPKLSDDEWERLVMSETWESS